MPQQMQPLRKRGAYWNDRELTELLRKQREVFRREKRPQAPPRNGEDDHTKTLDSSRSVVSSI